MKIIFLDIDGVLVNRASFSLPKSGSGSHSRAHPDCVKALNYIIEKTGAHLVISSVWRMYGTPKMKKILDKWGVKGRIVGITPRISVDRGRLVCMDAPRGLEIQRWLDVHDGEIDDIESFVILDDDSDMEHLIHRLVKTEGWRGLTMEDAEKAVKLLEDHEAK